MDKLNKNSLGSASAKIKNITAINLILGRNGSGKSRFLRRLEVELINDVGYNVRYISPERAGVFKRDGNIDTNIENDKSWLRSVRAQNQASNFKAASASLLREVEIVYLRRMQDDAKIREDLKRNFRTDRLDKINSLLSNIYIDQEGSNFVIKTYQGEVVDPENISSGESEAISLAAEIMHFFEKIDQMKFNVLLLDEPDVHLHPDLQARLSKFIAAMIERLPHELMPNVAIIIATHSTPFICAISQSEYTSIGNKEFNKSEVVQVPITEHLKKIAPFFGHPLSQSLNNDALLILEGEDDERVWQQAARSAQGRIKVFPVLAGSVDQQSELEKFCGDILTSLYDDPIGFSLRDGDGKAGKLSSIGPITRFRLNCYAVENMLLTDEALAVLNTTWDEFKVKVAEWIRDNSNRRDVEIMKELINTEDRMRHKKIKSMRQLICGITGSTKPWEVVIGQALGKSAINESYVGNSSTSILNFLGLEAAECLLNLGR